jgi:hypothetical protein
MVKRSGELVTKLEGAQQMLARASLGMPAARPVVEAALRRPAWEDRRYALGLVAAAVLGGLVGVVARVAGVTELEGAARPPAARALVVLEKPSEVMDSWRVLPQDCVARERATTQAPTMERLAAGSRLKVVTVEGGWHKVMLAEGREGWTGPGCWSP